MNLQGVYVLQDNNFRWFARMAHDQSSAESVKKVTPVSWWRHDQCVPLDMFTGSLIHGTHTLFSLQYLWFPCGILRGILSNLGIPSVVVAETSALPGCTFQIKIAKAP